MGIWKILLLEMNKWKNLKKKLSSTWFLKIKYHIKKKEKEKEKIKIIHSTVHTLKANYYLKYL